jgi:serine protease Do
MFRRFFPGGERGEAERFELPSTGSGFVVSQSGHILTNHHVIAHSDAVFVRFTGEQREFPAELIGIDPNTDLAVLKIEPDRTLDPLPFGDSDSIEVGDWAIAIGNPFGNLEGSLTVGVISAKGRSDLVIHGGSPRYQDFIQTDASINFGNSGGPLVDIDGRVIGVNTAVNTGGQGISFAIPSKLAQRIYTDLADHGRVIRGYLGIRTAEVQPVPDEGIKTESRGARILAVIPESPADKAGLTAGDVIFTYRDQDIQSPQHLQFLVAESEVGEAITCEVERDGERVELSVVPSEFVDDSAIAQSSASEGWQGLEVASLAGSDPRVERLKDALGITATIGLIVVTVQSDSPAAEAGIRPGDVLVSIAGEEVLGMESYRRIRAQLSGRMDPIEFLVRTGTTENYVQVLPRETGLEQ